MTLRACLKQKEACSVPKILGGDLCQAAVCSDVLHAPICSVLRVACSTVSDGYFRAQVEMTTPVASNLDSLC